LAIKDFFEMAIFLVFANFCGYPVFLDLCQIAFCDFGNAGGYRPANSPRLQLDLAHARFDRVVIAIRIN
jgi:hypothetical protein